MHLELAISFQVKSVIFFELCNELWIHYESTVYFVNSLWIHYLFLTIKYDFRVCFANSLCIIYVIREFTIFFADHYELTFIFHSMFTIIFFRWFAIDSLSFSRIHYKIMKSLSVSRINNGSIMFLANSL